MTSSKWLYPTTWSKHMGWTKEQAAARRKKFTSRPSIAPLYRQVRALAELINVERKVAESSFSGSVNTSGNLVLLNGLTLGDTKYTRDGQSIKMNSILMRWTASLNASATRTTMRVIIFVDKQANAAAPTIANVLDSVSTYSPMNLDYGSRFRIMYDRFLTLDDVNTAFRHGKVFKKLNFHCKYDTSNNGDITDITTNSVYLLLLSNEPTNTPSFAMDCRMRFIDN